MILIMALQYLPMIYLCPNLSVSYERENWNNCFPLRERPFIHFGCPHSPHHIGLTCFPVFSRSLSFMLEYQWPFHAHNWLLWIKGKVKRKAECSGNSPWSRKSNEALNQYRKQLNVIYPYSLFHDLKYLPQTVNISRFYQRFI